MSFKPHIVPAGLKAKGPALPRLWHPERARLWLRRQGLSLCSASASCWSSPSLNRVLGRLSRDESTLGLFIDFLLYLCSLLFMFL